jgi:hypothetical protein
MGFTTLFFMWIIKPAVEPKQEALYHWSGPARNFFLPVALDFLLLWLVLVCLLLLARAPGRRHTIIWGGLLLLTPWFVGQTLHALDLTPITHQLDRILLLGGVLGTILLAVRWRPASAPRFDRFVDTASTILVFAGCFGVFMLAQLTVHGWKASRLMGAFPLHQRAALPTQPHRIVWIVFDELSYQQTFEHRFPGLPLPAFDALAATSTTFTQAQPFDIYTEVVLPGLFAGIPFDDMKATSTISLSVHNPLTSKWQTFDQRNTVFQDALNAGYSTAVVGWDNPYCRIIPAVLDSCYWTLRDPVNFTLPSSSIVGNMIAPLKKFTWLVLNAAPASVRIYAMNRLHIPVLKFLITQSHIDDYIDLDAHTQTLLQNPSYSFVLLHLPVPHPWGIYDRQTGKFTTAGSSYLNNLALADKCLAGIRHTLEQTGQWNSSTVVVMGDHSWRTHVLWHLPKPGYGWAQEDELASHGGQYDPRPAYLVKLPNQTTAARIDAPFHTVHTRKLFDALMTHQIQTPTDLATWAHAIP